MRIYARVGTVRNFTNVALQKQNTIFNLRAQMQNALALLDYLNHIVPQKLIPTMQVFTKKFLRQETQAELFLLVKKPHCKGRCVGAYILV
jgi:hypothetical protein